MNKTAKVLGRCARCETLPCVVQGTGRLYLWFPMGHSLNKFISYLQSSRFEHQLLEDEQCLVVNLKENEITGTAIELEAVLTSKELQDIRVLIYG